MVTVWFDCRLIWSMRPLQAEVILLFSHADRMIPLLWAVISTFTNGNAARMNRISIMTAT